VTDEFTTPSGDEAVAASEDVVTAEIIELTEAELQRDEFKAVAQQLQADFENYKKRVSRDIEDASVRGGARLINAIMPVLDAFDLAVAHFNEESNDEAKALIQSRQLLVDSLAKEGLERLGVNGEPFDPQVHDAVMHVEGEGDVQLVDDVLRAGYRWKGVVVRPAMVRVKG
jgi:molecular chaperone GrpE